MGLIIVGLVGCGNKDNSKKKNKVTKTSSKIDEETVNEKNSEDNNYETEAIDIETTNQEVELTTNKAEGVKNYTYSGVEYIVIYGVHKDSAKVYNQPSSAGKVIDTFQRKQMMYVVSVCNETGWYKIEYDDSILSSKNAPDYVFINYKGDNNQGKYISFKDEAKNIKVGYINPADVCRADDWEYKITVTWNGIKLREHFSWDPADVEFYKSLCFAERFTPIEKSGNNVIGMFVPNSEDYNKAYNILEQYGNQKGYLIENCGGSGLSDNPPVFFITALYIPIENQYGRFWITGGSGEKVNWDYFTKTYGYSREDVLRKCSLYAMWSDCDRNIGKWEDDREVIYTIAEMAEVCRIVDQYTEEYFSLPNIYEFDINTVIREWQNDSVLRMYYLYTNDTSADVRNMLDEEMNLMTTMAVNVEESICLYETCKEGELYMKELIITFGK